MSQYRVIWGIDIEADSPLGAAKEVRKIQLDPDSEATFFDVVQSSEPGQGVFVKHEVDLMEEE